MITTPLTKIDILMSDVSQYSVLHHFSKKLFEAFKRIKIDCRLLKREGRIDTLKHDPPQLTVSFNGLPMVENEAYICDALKIPHLTILVDPPQWGGVFMIESPYIILGCDDEYGCDFLEGLNFSRSLFIPHAVEPELKPNPAIEKIYDVAILASYLDYEAERAAWIDAFPEPIRKIMNEAAEVSFEDPNLSFVQVFVSSFFNIARQYSLGSLSSMVFTDALQSLERYVKGRDRCLLIKALEDVPLHVFGNHQKEPNWRTFLGKYPNIQIHDAVKFEEALEVMKKTKILLNPCIKNKRGSHERFFTGTACGALVISSECQYLKEHFIENEEVILYKHSHLEELTGIIKNLVNHSEKRNAIVEKARAKVMLHHTWDARVKAFMPRLTELVQEINNSISSP